MAEPAGDALGQPPGSLEARALWWARFMVQYGVSTILAGLLLAVILGWISAPMFSGSKVVETDMLNASLRIESNLAAILVRLIALHDQGMGMQDAIDRLTCAHLMTAEDKVSARRLSRTKDDLNRLCEWMTSGSVRGLSGEPPP